MRNEVVLYYCYDSYRAARHGFRLNGKLNRISQQETKKMVTDTSTKEAVLERVKSNTMKNSSSSRSREGKERISIDESEPSNTSKIEKTMKLKTSKEPDNRTTVSVDESEVENNTNDVDVILRHNTSCSKSIKNNKKRKRNN